MPMQSTPVWRGALCEWLYGALHTYISYVLLCTSSEGAIIDGKVPNEKMHGILHKAHRNALSALNLALLA